VTGNYEQIRKFSEAVLNAMPVMALEQITFRRKKATDTQIEAEIRLTLYLVHS
jgi:Tfp pilus assembly protein PilO